MLSKETGFDEHAGILGQTVQVSHQFQEFLGFLLDAEVNTDLPGLAVVDLSTR
jgi:hypothetical protein